MIVEFEKTKSHYKVTGCAKMKNPVTREWMDCIIYESYKEWNGSEYVEVQEPETYVRENVDFGIKFVPCLDL